MGIICMFLVNICFLAIVLNCSLGSCVYIILLLAHPHGQGQYLNHFGLIPFRIHVNHNIMLLAQVSQLQVVTASLTPPQEACKNNVHASGGKILRDVLFREVRGKKKGQTWGLQKYWRLMTSLETCPHLQEELEAVTPLPGQRVHTVTLFCIWMIYSKKTHPHVV